MSLLGHYVKHINITSFLCRYVASVSLAQESEKATFRVCFVRVVLYIPTSLTLAEHSRMIYISNDLDI